MRLLLATYHFFSILSFCFVFCLPMICNAKKDTTNTKWDFYRIGIDVLKLPISMSGTYYNTYEFTADVHYKKDLYLVSDFGFGNSAIDNDNLSIKSSNTFIKLGLDKTFFSKEFKGDMDNAFIGLRYAFSGIKTYNVKYTIQDTIWGFSQGDINNRNFHAHWLELTAGFRLEIVKSVFLGWNMRFASLLNPKKFEILPPPYMSGFGRGDANTAFGFNFFILYGWGKRN